MSKHSYSQPHMQKSSVRRSQRQTTHLSQPVYNEIEKSEQLEEAADSVATYALLHLNNKKIIRRAEMLKLLTVKGVPLNKAIDAANEKLKNVYGCELRLYDETKSKTPGYFIKKLTPYVKIPNFNEAPQNKELLTVLIMSFVFMNKEKCSEASLYGFLEKMGFDLSDEENNGDYGNVTEHLKELTKSRMIDMENNEVIWGPQAAALVNKMEILKFVNKVYKSRMESWGDLYASAQKQIEIDQLGEEQEDVAMDSDS